MIKDAHLSTRQNFICIICQAWLEFDCKVIYLEKYYAITFLMPQPRPFGATAARPSIYLRVFWR